MSRTSLPYFIFLFPRVFSNIVSTSVHPIYTLSDFKSISNISFFCLSSICSVQFILASRPPLNMPFNCLSTFLLFLLFPLKKKDAVNYLTLEIMPNSQIRHLFSLSALALERKWHKLWNAQEKENWHLYWWKWNHFFERRAMNCLPWLQGKQRDSANIKIVTDKFRKLVVPRGFKKMTNLILKEDYRQKWHSNERNSVEERKRDLL